MFILFEFNKKVKNVNIL